MIDRPTSDPRFTSSPAEEAADAAPDAAAEARESSAKSGETTGREVLKLAVPAVREPMPLQEIGRSGGQITSVSADLTRPPKRWAHGLLLTVVICIGLFVFWANWATLDEVTRGEGRVVPASKIQKVQNLEGGIVREILTRDGALVKKGQVILRIDSTGFGSTVAERREQLVAMRATIIRLRAEVANKPLKYPADFARARPDLVRREMALYQSRQRESKAALNSLRQQLRQREQEIAETRSRITHAEKGLKLAKEELELTKPLVRRGLTSKVQYIQLQTRVNELDEKLSAAKLALPRLMAARNEAERRIDERRSGDRSKALTQLNEVEARAAALTKAVEADQDKVNRTLVRAPVSGIVKEVKVSTVGQVVKPGDDLVEIVPLNDTLLIEAQIRPSDIAFLHAGQKAVVKITAYDFTIYGTLPGTVERIGADTVTNDRGESFYKILVRTKRSYLLSGKRKLNIIPGMIAQVDVLTGEKTVLEYLIKPLTRLRHEALRER